MDFVFELGHTACEFLQSLGVVSFSTAAACPGCAVLLVDRFRQDALLLGWAFAAGDATAFACAFFLALVLRASAFLFTGVAKRATVLWLNRSRCFELIVS